MSMEKTNAMKWHTNPIYRCMAKTNAGKLQTFKVDKVEQATNLLERSTIEEQLAMNVKVKCEALFHTEKEIVSVARMYNKFVATVHTAYSKHYPLVLTPDVIWMCIAQGFATHVNANAERLRHFFVQHEGKKELIVRSDDFIKGSPSNPWPKVFDAFSAQIQEEVGDEIYGALTPSFTTTGPVERAAAQLVIMDAFKEYLEYRVYTLCGIPEITLEGTIGDWTALKEKAMALTDFGLSWWTDELGFVMNEFVEAASGRVDQQFWSSIYKIRGGSGGPFISGWICTLFPYIGDDKRNPYLKSWHTSNEARGHGMTSSHIPPGLCSTPFIWNYLGTEYPMSFYSGFMAVSQDPSTLALRPEIGWAVADHQDCKLPDEF